MTDRYNMAQQYPDLAVQHQPGCPNEGTLVWSCCSSAPGHSGLQPLASQERTIVVTFTLDEGVTDQQAEEAVEAMVTQAPIEMGVLTYEGCEVRYG